MSVIKQEQLLRERAKRLAQKSSLPEEIKDAREIVLFTLNNETYAVEVQQIKAIQPLGEITRLPGLAKVVPGVITFSGIIYTVFDLKQIFGLQPQASGEQHLIIIEHPHLKVCFLIDRVIDYRIISEKEIQTQVTGIKSKEKGYIKGLLKDSTVLIDVPNILKDQQSLFNLF